MPYPVIFNGDHAEFEAEHADTCPQDRPDWPLPSFDARDWSKAFCRRFLIQNRAGYDTAPVDDDEGLMQTWFANALMRGYDEHASRCKTTYKTRWGFKSKTQLPLFMIWREHWHGGEVVHADVRFSTRDWIGL